MEDETKGNMELPIEGPAVSDTRERDEYFEMLEKKDISALREVPLGRVYFPPKEDIYAWIRKGLKILSLQSSTHDPTISDKVELKEAAKEPIKDVSAIEKEQEQEQAKVAEEYAEVVAEDFSMLESGWESEGEDEYDELSEVEATTAQLIACRFADVDGNELKTLRELLRARNPDNQPIVKYNIDMTELKLSCLRPSTWLNDEVRISFCIIDSHIICITLSTQILISNECFIWFRS